MYLLQQFINSAFILLNKYHHLKKFKFVRSHSHIMKVNTLRDLSNNKTAK